MTQLNEIYKCSVCGNIVEMVHPATGTLVCCGEHMQLLKEKTQDTGMEKHVPVTVDNDGKVKIKVGAVTHPMEEEHYIEWIEVVSLDRVRRKYLSPGMQPEMIFCKPSSDVKIRAYCNVHGLWSDK
jgi:superoxide reductase